MNIYTFYVLKNQEIFNQALFCITSIFQKENLINRNDMKIVIHTDKPEVFRNFFKEGCTAIELHHKTIEQFNDWMVKPGNKLTNIHRIKLKTIEDVFKNNPNSQVILLDCDTYLLESLQPHFENLKKTTTYMHKDEGNIAYGMKPGLRAHRRFFESNKFSVNGQLFILPKTAHMFNAGVVGIGSQYAHLINEMIDMQDDIFESTRYYNAEQFSLSHILQTKTNLRATDDVVRHYWYLKEFQTTVNKFVATYKDKSFNEILNSTLPTQKMPSYEGFKKLTYNVPYKLKKKLFEMKLIKNYVSFE